MNNSNRRQFLEASLQQIDAFLQNPAIRRLERIGFEDRRDTIMQELASMSDTDIIITLDAAEIAQAITEYLARQGRLPVPCAYGVELRRIAEEGTERIFAEVGAPK